MSVFVPVKQENSMVLLCPNHPACALSNKRLNMDLTVCKFLIGIRAHSGAGGDEQLQKAFHAIIERTLYSG